MDEISPLLTPRHTESVDLPSPNLRPRHRELIPTPCGPIKPWSELTCLVKVYYCFTITSLVGVLALTLVNVYRQFQKNDSYEEESVSLIQLVGILFCLYYVTRGILQENRQELIAFVLSVLLVMVRSVVNFTVLPPEERRSLLLVRFVCILFVGMLHVVCATLLVQRPNMMAFRVGGALESLQEQYFLLNLCFSMVTFDLQAQLCLCILIITSSMSLSYSHNIILGFGVIWACFTAAVGAIAVSLDRTHEEERSSTSVNYMGFRNHRDSVKQLDRALQSTQIPCNARDQCSDLRLKRSERNEYFCISLSGSKRIKAACLDFRPSKPARAGLFNLPSLRGECGVGTGQVLQPGSGRRHWLLHLGADQRRAVLVPVPAVPQLRPGPEGAHVCLRPAVRPRPLPARSIMGYVPSTMGP